MKLMVYFLINISIYIHRPRKKARKHGRFEIPPPVIPPPTPDTSNTLDLTWQQPDTRLAKQILNCPSNMHQIWSRPATNHEEQRLRNNLQKAVYDRSMLAFELHKAGESFKCLTNLYGQEKAKFIHDREQQQEYIRALHDKINQLQNALAPSAEQAPDKDKPLFSLSSRELDRTSSTASYGSPNNRTGLDRNALTNSYSGISSSNAASTVSISSTSSRVDYMNGFIRTVYAMTVSPELSEQELINKGFVLLFPLLFYTHFHKLFCQLFLLVVTLFKGWIKKGDCRKWIKLAVWCFKMRVKVRTSDWNKTVSCWLKRNGGKYKCKTLDDVESKVKIEKKLDVKCWALFWRKVIVNDNTNWDIENAYDVYEPK